MSDQRTNVGSPWLVALMIGPHEVSSIAARPAVGWIVITLRRFAFLAGVMLANAAVWGEALPGSPRAVAGVSLAISCVMASVAVWLARRSWRASVAVTDLA